MDKKDFINEISDAFRKEELSLFLGAGSSIDAMYPSWKKLLTPCAKELGLNIDDISDYFQLAQYYINEFSSNKLYKLINEELNKYTYNSKLLDSIVDIGFKSIWTTNFDKVIEKNFENNKINVNTIHDAVDLSSVNLKNRINIFKINGDIGNITKIVLSKSDIVDYDKTHGVFLTFLQQELMTNTFLFIGYSFKDQIILNQIHKLQTYLGENKKSFYTIMIDEENNKKFDLFISDLEKRYNIKVLKVKKSEDIYEILQEIKKKIISKNIFISGSLDTTDDEEYVYGICKEICNNLLENGFNIVTGFGKNIGYYISGASLQKLYKLNESNIDKRLIMRPFAHDMSNEDDAVFRKNLIKNTCFSIFLYGQAKDKSGKIVNSKGTKEEFEISKDNNNIIIPIASTEFASREIFNHVKDNLIQYPYLENYLNILDKEISPEKIAKTVLTIIEENINT